MRPAGLPLFLCRIDPYTGKEYIHRNEWILDRMGELAGFFAIKVGDRTKGDVTHFCVAFARTGFWLTAWL
jgi:hypothetical protein